MTIRKLTVRLGIGLSLASTAFFSACASDPSCQDLGTSCGGSSSGGGNQGGSAGNGSTSGSGGKGGSSSSEGGNAGSSGASAGASEAGSAGAAPCDGQCSGDTPICDIASNACVECLGKTDCKDSSTPACNSATNSCVQCLDKTDCKDAAKPACDVATSTCVECADTPDCKDSAKPLCDKTAEQCVACLQQSDCKVATASKCNAGACAPCTVDAECSNIAGKGVCNAGTCVQCNIAKESVCAGKSCNPATNQCTTIPVGTVDYCQPCLADSECIGGNQSDPDARCVPVKFMGVPRVGGFCLKRVAKTCSPPFGVPTSVVSLSGAPFEAYCGIDQSSTRCEAVLDLVASKACPDGMDTSCGCARNNTGTCIDSGQGGLCKTVGAFANTCTIPCAAANQCLTTLTCTSAVPYCH